MCKFFFFVFAAYDFLNSDISNFNVSIWYNSTYKNDTGNGPLALLRVPRSVNLVSIPNFIILLLFSTTL